MIKNESSFFESKQIPYSNLYDTLEQKKNTTTFYHQVSQLTLLAHE